MDQTILREFAEAYTNAWCSKNPDMVASFYEEGGSLSVNDGDPAIGRNAIAEVALGFMTAFPDMTVHFDDLAFEGQELRYHWTLTGTNTGAEGTGRSVRISGYEVWELGPNDLISRSRGHFDQEDYQKQLRA